MPHPFHIPQCSIQNRNVHISVLNGALWDMEQVHSGICEIGLLLVIVRLSDSWWRHQMETFFALLALCAGNSPIPVNSPHKGQWRGSLMLSLICVWMNGCVNNRETGDLRRHRAHYDVRVMITSEITLYGMGPRNQHQTTTKHNKTWAECILLWHTYESISYIALYRKCSFRGSTGCLNLMCSDILPHPIIWLSNS